MESSWSTSEGEALSTAEPAYDELVGADEAVAFHRPKVGGRGRLALRLTAAGIRAVAIAAAMLLSVAFRTSALSTYGFSSDELRKVDAIAQYSEGHFGANAEHPMLMKLAMWGSVHAANAWNRHAHPARAIALESALRLPGALAGTATTYVLYRLGGLLFGPSVAVAAAMIWAFDPNAIAINRIGKEETFLLLFLVLAVWCYERAKRQGAADPSGAQRWYTAAGVMFGLMLASKYMPYYLGIYGLVNIVADRHPGANRPRPGRYYAAMGLAFLSVNFAVLFPSTWAYAVEYLRGALLLHHGYSYGQHLYVINIPVSPLGVPPWFYLHYLATKVPIVVLAALAVGLGVVVRHRSERGYVLLRVLLAFPLVLFSLVAAKFLRYMLPVHAVLDLTAAVGLVAMLNRLFGWHAATWARRAAVGIVLVGFGGSLVSAPLSAAPFYSLYENAIGERLAQPGSVFPEEGYDYGVREATVAIARVAASGAIVVSDVSDVVAHYLALEGRADIEAITLSGQGIPNDRRETWILVQDEHIYFETRELISQLRHRLTPWREVRAGRALVLQVFRRPEVGDRTATHTTSDLSHQLAETPETGPRGRDTLRIRPVAGY